jgi:hypothetical protein
MLLAVFRGTNDPSDWEINLDSIPESSGDARIAG